MDPSPLPAPPAAVLHALFDAAPEGLVVLAADGALLYGNRRFLALWDFPAGLLARGDTAALRAHTAAQLADPEAYLASLERLLQTQEPSVLDELALRDGRVFERHVTPLPLPGGERALVVRWRDVTERARTARSLRAMQERMAALFQHTLDAVLLADDQGRYIDANPAAERLLGRDRETLLRLQVADLVVPGTLDVDATWSGFLSARSSRGQVQLRRGDGGIIVAQFAAVAQVQPGVNLSVMRDVTEAVRNQQRLEELATLLDLAIEGSDLAYWDVDLRSGSLEAVNGHWHRMLGYGPEDMGRTLAFWESLVHPDDRPARDAAWRAHLNGDTPGYEAEFRLRHRDGHWVWVLSRGRATARDGEGRALRVVGTRMDISTRKQAEQQLARLADTDPLTGALNRRRFVDMASMRIGQGPLRHPAALLMMDLDHFKRLNDRHGHAVGDQALRGFVAVAREVMRDTDVFARLGGEEFGALLADTDEPGARALADRLAARVRGTPVATSAGPVPCTVSIGVAVAPAGAVVTLDLMLQRADRALYAAKSAGRDRVEVDTLPPAVGVPG